MSLLNDVLKDIHNFGDAPLLFTPRTTAEGGKADVTDDEYSAILGAVAYSGAADLIDVKMLGDATVVTRCVQSIHDANVYVIGSNHDFQHVS